MKWTNSTDQYSSGYLVNLIFHDLMSARYRWIIQADDETFVQSNRDFILVEMGNDAPFK